MIRAFEFVIPNFHRSLKQRALCGLYPVQLGVSVVEIFTRFVIVKTLNIAWAGSGRLLTQLDEAISP